MGKKKIAIKNRLTLLLSEYLKLYFNSNAEHKKGLRPLIGEHIAIIRTLNDDVVKASTSKRGASAATKARQEKTQEKIKMQINMYRLLQTSAFSLRQFASDANVSTIAATSSFLKPRMLISCYEIIV